MQFRFVILCFTYFRIANSQYYTVPAPSYASYLNYYPSSAPSYPPATPNLQPRSLTPSPSKLSTRNVGSTVKPSTKSEVKCSPQSACAYFLTTPSEKFKSNVSTKDKVKETKNIIPCSCALCNNFADIPLNSKIPPPPPVGSPVLPGIIEIIEKVPTISIPKNFTTKDSSSILSTKTKFSDMYEKHKVPKNLSFDQELLEGFLTGLGLPL